MLVPVKWLKEYVDINDVTAAFCEKMILAGSNIETASKLVGNFSKIVVGKIIKMEKHPEADKLFITQIDIGSEQIQIITGADNVFEGAFVPVILDGGVLPNGTKIKRGKLRGLMSNGMLCSAKELGFEDKVIPTSHKDGIMILDGEYELGKDILSALDLDDEVVVEFEITPNRPDCLSMLGMAREAAAVYPQKIRYPETKCTKETGEASDYISVEIKRPDLCRRYAARIVKDVKVQPSPWWLQKKLIAAGMRPINSIVDITNFVMLEYGQPIHAFDLRQVEDNKIVVDAVPAGKKFTTLDGTERTTVDETLLIWDGKKPVAIAGIMGGLNSEIEADTKDILIECANFEANNIRATSKKIGLRTEASGRYEKGVDPNLCMDAANRVCYLIEQLGAGTVIKGAVDVYPTFVAPWSVEVRTDRVSRLLGVKLLPRELSDMFNRLEIKTEIKGDVVVATPPTIRIDLLEEIDFVEEAARMYGYDLLPNTLPQMSVKGGKSPSRRLEDTAKETLLSFGYSEIQTYSFVSPKGVLQASISDKEKHNFIKLINPLGEETSVMRTTLIPGCLESIARNASRNITEVKCFELGKVFLNNGNSKEGENLPEERKYLVVAGMGAKEDFYTLKGAVVSMLEKVGIKDTTFVADTENTAFHPGRCANIIVGDKKIGVMGEIHPDTIERYDIRDRVNLAEIDFELVITMSDTEKLYTPIPKYPPVQRDIAMVVEEEVSVGDMEKIIREQGKKLLESIQLFDIYRGKQVKEGAKSVAFSLVYRDSEKTLTEEEVSKVHQKVLAALKEQLGAELRDM